MNEGHSSQDWKVELRRALMQYFNEQELRILCFDIDLDYESISTNGKGDTVIQMIDYGMRTGNILKLVELCEIQRPNVPWEGISFGAKEATMGSEPIRTPIRDRPVRERPPVVPVANYTQPDPRQTRTNHNQGNSNNSMILGWALGIIGILALLVAGGLFLTGGTLEETPTATALVAQPLPTDEGDISGTGAQTPTHTPIPTDSPVPPPPTATNTTSPPSPTPTPTPVRQGVPVFAPLNSLDADGWFPNLDPLIGGRIAEVKNSDLYSGQALAVQNGMGRITSYERTYRVANLCNSSNGLEAVYIQMFYFQNVTGARQFMLWATDNWTYSGVVARNDVGEQSYYFKRQSVVLEGGDCLLEADSYTYQKSNVVYRVVVYTPDGDLRWSDAAGRDQAIEIARWAAAGIP